MQALFRRRFASVPPKVLGDLDFLQNILQKITNLEDPKKVQGNRKNAGGKNAGGKFTRQDGKDGNKNRGKKFNKPQRFRDVKETSDSLKATNTKKSRFGKAPGMMDALDSSKHKSVYTNKSDARKKDGKSGAKASYKRKPRNARVFKRSGGAIEPQVYDGDVTAYTPDVLTPQSLLKYSAAAPVNQEFRVLNVCMELLKKKTANVSFITDNTIVKNCDRIISYQEVFKPGFIPWMKTNLDCDASETVSEFLYKSGKLNAPLKEARSLKNIIEGMSVFSKENDLKLFNSIVKGEAADLKDKKLASKKLIDNLEVVKKALNNNLSYDDETRARSFGPCIGEKSVKQLVANK